MRVRSVLFLKGTSGVSLVCSPPFNLVQYLGVRNEGFLESDLPSGLQGDVTLRVGKVSCTEVEGPGKGSSLAVN